MDSKELEKKIKKQLKSLLEESRPPQRDDFTAPKDWVGEILAERQEQRKKVFLFSLGASNAALMFLIGIISIQAIYRIAMNNPNFSFFSGAELPPSSTVAQVPVSPA